MKLLFILPFLLIGLIPLAYGDISILIDKEVYNEGDSIQVTGSLSDDYEYDPNHTVTVGVTNDSNGKREFSDTYPINEDMTFSASLPTSILDESGMYSVYVLYGLDDSLDNISFEFVKTERQTSPEDYESFNPITEINERLDSLEQRNKELMTENRDLKNQISDLNKRIDDLMSIIQEQMNVMLKFFS